ncbi:MAG: zinc-dependent alcohol dehydrogenase family protein [Simkaniaceae bacterium]|nr:zinc-dependent alcohol dehydrogenase family protein [Candidatus Sacchlamyda saccharinae]
MRAMVLEEANKPLTMQDLLLPSPGEGEVLIKVKACSVCRTDLHIYAGELKEPKLPLIMGHQIVGTIEGEDSLVGVPWLGKTCGVCPYCKRDEENLCDDPTFTGYTINGGFAEYVVANKAFVFPIPDGYSEIQAAPLLCAGMIGYRSLKMVETAEKIGFYGFGAAAHLLIQVAKYQGKQVYAFTRKGDTKTQEKALELGAVWAGDSETKAPDELDAAILFAPVGSLVPTALRAVRKGGIVVSAGIHMSDIPSFPYSILWGERVLRSVANLTRKDGEEFLALAPKIPIQTEVTTYPLEKANEALRDLKEGNISGSAVIIP